MKLALVSDTHADVRSRWSEFLRIMKWAADDMTERGVDMTLHGGDWSQRKTEPVEHNALIDWTQQIRRRRPLCGLRGNHDFPGDLAKLNQVKAPHPVVIEEGAGVHRFKIRDTEVGIACMSWVEKGELLAQTGSTSGLETEQTAADLMRDVLRGLGDELATVNGPRILLIHGMVTGSKVSGGETMVGTELELSLSDLALARADFVGLGHIHKGQEWPYQIESLHTPNIIQIAYPGSMFATAYGELEDKCYLVIEGPDQRDENDRWVPTIERVVTPRTPMILAEADYIADHDLTEAADRVGAYDYQLVVRPYTMMGQRRIDYPGVEAMAGAEVRFRYHYEADRREAAKRAAEAWKADIIERFRPVDVKLDPIERQTYRARVPEIVNAVTMHEKLDTLWTATDTMPLPDRRLRLFACSDRLEREVADQ